MPHGGTPNENYSPFEGGAGGCPVANMAWKPKDTPQRLRRFPPWIGGIFRGEGGLPGQRPISAKPGLGGSPRVFRQAEVLP